MAIFNYKKIENTNLTSFLREMRIKQRNPIYYENNDIE